MNSTEKPIQPQDIAKSGEILLSLADGELANEVLANFWRDQETSKSTENLITLFNTLVAYLQNEQNPVTRYKKKAR